MKYSVWCFVFAYVLLPFLATLFELVYIRNIFPYLKNWWNWEGKGKKVSKKYWHTLWMTLSFSLEWMEGQFNLHHLILINDPKPICHSETQFTLPTWHDCRVPNLLWCATRNFSFLQIFPKKLKMDLCTEIIFFESNAFLI